MSSRRPNHEFEILATTNTDTEEARHTVAGEVPTTFTWDYTISQSSPLARLERKALGSQWDPDRDLPWDTEVDVEADIYRSGGPPSVEAYAAIGYDLSRTPMATWGEREWLTQERMSHTWRLSQFLHGEQGALLCAARIVETHPDADAKFYAATQAVDEARHVKVFSRYLDEKIEGQLPINAHLRMLLDDIVSDSRWDITCLGMQIMVEGLALAAFGALSKVTPEPLLRDLLGRVMADEARHVGFGITSLGSVYSQMSATELAERAEFCFEASLLMRDRFIEQEVWAAMGVDPMVAIKAFDRPDAAKNEDPFRQLLFSRIVPACRRIGLLDANDGWLRRRFDNIGLSIYFDAPDPVDPLG